MATTRQQFLTFTVGNEEYGAPILGVREIVEYFPVTRVPTTPAFIRGVIHLRGQALPVVDLRAKLGMGESEITRRSCFVLVEVSLAEETVPMGILVDEVSQVIELGEDEIEAVPAFGTRIRVEYLKGLGRTAGHQLVLLLDIDKVMSGDEILAAAQAAADVEEEQSEPARSNHDDDT